MVKQVGGLIMVGMGLLFLSWDWAAIKIDGTIDISKYQLKMLTSSVIMTLITDNKEKFPEINDQCFIIAQSQYSCQSKLC